MSTRRQALALGAGLSAFGTAARASAMAHAPASPFTRVVDGVASAFGEVRVATVGAATLPVRIDAAAGLAAIDASSEPFVRFGADAPNAVRLTSDGGVRFGAAGTPFAWSTATFEKLLRALQSDLRKARGALLLRAVLHTCYPVAVHMRRFGMPPDLAAILARSSRDLGADAFRHCEAVHRPAPPARSHVSSLGAVFELTGIVATALSARLCPCGTCVGRFWPSPWDLPGIAVARLFPQLTGGFSPSDIDEARGFLSAALPTAAFGRCLLSGDWSFAPLGALDDGISSVPHTVRVDVSPECADRMARADVRERMVSWAPALDLLAGMSSELAAATGIAPAPRTLALVAAAGGRRSPAIVCAVSMLAFIALVVLFGASVSAQLALYPSRRNRRIEHAAFAPALIALAASAGTGAALPPPIVVPT